MAEASVRRRRPVREWVIGRLERFRKSNEMAFGLEPRWNPRHSKTGRGGGIRTHGPLRPRQVRYQAALRPDSQPFWHCRLTIAMLDSLRRNRV